MEKILIVEDHPVVSQMISLVIANSFHAYSTVVVETAEDMRRKLQNIEPNGFPFVLAIVDLHLPDSEGLSALVELRIHYKIPVLVMTMESDMHIIQACKNNGASGFLQKSTTIEDLIKTIKIILHGGEYFPDLKDESKCNGNLFETLSPRQQQVLDLVLVGRSNKFIAADLGIGEGHVRNIVSLLFDVFSVTGRSRTHLSAIVSTLGYRSRATLK